MKKYVIFFGLLLSFNVLSDSFCTGKVSVLSIGRGGTVLVKGPGGLPYTYLCSTESQFNGVKTSACKVMYSTLLTAQAQDKSVDITFNPGISSCSSIANWSAATGVNWVMLK